MPFWAFLLALLTSFCKATLLEYASCEKVLRGGQSARLQLHFCLLTTQLILQTMLFRSCVREPTRYSLGFCPLKYVHGYENIVTRRTQAHVTYAGERLRDRYETPPILRKVISFRGTSKRPILLT